MDTIRVQQVDGSWLECECRVIAPGEIEVPMFVARWLICETGMIANVGGNDWRIYTLHPDDCARLCKKGVDTP